MNPTAQRQRYVPAWVQRALLTEDDVRQCSQDFSGALMIADVSGFTALGERLASVGEEGAEVLFRVVNDFFGSTSRLVEAHGGELIRFAGDAPIAIWPVRDGETKAQATHRAAQCALALQRDLGEYKTSEGTVVRFRVALAAGHFVAASLGGTRGRFEPFVAGEPFTKAAGALDVADVGEVVLDGDTASLLNRATFQTASDGMMRLIGLDEVLHPRSLVPIHLEPVQLEALSCFVPRGVRSRVDAGHGGWLGEFRMVSTVFVSIRGLTFDHVDVVDGLRKLVNALQAVVYRYDGSVNQFLEDDKGTVLLAAWGLPSTTHENDPERACKAAIELVRVLRASGLDGTAGVSTGRVFCGVKGSQVRAEYGLLGAKVNLSARLMCASDSGVLVDPDTAEASQSSVQFSEPLSVSQKRGNAALTAHRVLRTRRSATLVPPLHGRAAERETIRSLLGTLADHQSGVVLIEAEAGMGKSVLLEDARKYASQLGLRVLVGHADAIERNTPYYAARQVYLSLLGLDSQSTTEQRIDALNSWMDTHPTVLDLSPLLNPVLGLDLHDTLVTREMEGQARSERLRLLLNDMLSQQTPLLILIEDVHWIDSASWDWLRIAIRDVQPLQVMISTRPKSEGSAQFYDGMGQLPKLTHIQLQSMPESDVVSMVSRCLGVEELPNWLSSVIMERTGGHPFFAEELVYALRDSGVFGVENGRCVLRQTLAELEQSGVPETLKGVIASRLDLLDPVGLMSVKTASVVGRSFSESSVVHLYPMDADRDQVANKLQSLTEQSLTVVEIPEPELTYLFRHALTQQVAYGQLSFQQRRELHERAARWYESGRAGSPERFYGRIAYHWQRANMKREAIDSLERAGDQAYRGFVHREAIAYYEAAEAICDGTEQRSRRSRWLLHRGVGHSNLGQLTEGLNKLTQAIAMMGFGVPKSSVTQVFGIVKQLAIQTYRRWMGPPVPRTENRKQALQAVEALNEIGLLAYYHGRIPLTLYSSLRALNLAESYGESPELAMMKAGISIVVSGASMPSLAEKYSLESIRLAAQFENSTAVIRTQQYRGALLVQSGRYEAARAHADVALERSKVAGHSRGQDEARHLHFYVNCRLGNLNAAHQWATEMERSAIWREDVQIVFWARCARAETLWLAGNSEEALAILRHMDASNVTDSTMRTRYYGLRVHCLSSTGEIAEALAISDEFLSHLNGQGTFLEDRGYSALCAVLIGQLRLNPLDGTLKKRCKRACKLLGRFASIFKLAEVESRRYQAELALALGQRSLGIEGLRDAARLAGQRRQSRDELHILKRIELFDAAAERDRAAIAKLERREGGRIDDRGVNKQAL